MERRHRPSTTCLAVVITIPEVPGTFPDGHLERIATLARGCERLPQRRCYTRDERAWVAVCWTGCAVPALRWVLCRGPAACDGGHGLLCFGAVLDTRQGVCRRVWDRGCACVWPWRCSGRSVDVSRGGAGVATGAGRPTAPPPRGRGPERAQTARTPRARRRVSGVRC